MGTPAKDGAPVTLTIDGIDVTVPEGTSVMRAAAEAGIAVPEALRHRQRGGLRLLPACVVEIEGGAARPPPARRRWPRVWSSAPRPKVKKIRRGVMELYISDHPLDCLTCAANGDCELQDMAGAVGLRDVRYDATRTGSPTISRRGTPPARRTPNGSPRTTSNPYFTYDPSKCIVCSRCVRACEEVQGTFALTIEGRGFDSRVSAGGAGDDFLFRLRQLRRLRAGLPDGDPAGEIGLSSSARPRARSSPPAPIAGSAVPSRRN
jgi:formate dehydrogenase major subunit